MSQPDTAAKPAAAENPATPATQAVNVCKSGSTTDLPTIISEVVINETLCYAVSMFAKTTAVKLKTILNSFCTTEELIGAKELLIRSIENVNSNVLPRYSKRKGDSCGKLSVDDIYDALSIADEHQILCKLPKFAAVSIDRIPTTRAEDIDIVSNVMRISGLRWFDMLSVCLQKIGCHVVEVWLLMELEGEAEVERHGVSV